VPLSCLIQQFTRLTIISSDHPSPGPSPCQLPAEVAPCSCLRLAPEAYSRAEPKYRSTGSVSRRHPASHGSVPRHAPGKGYGPLHQRSSLVYGPEAVDVIAGHHAGLAVPPCELISSQRRSCTLRHRTVAESSMALATEGRSTPAIRLTQARRGCCSSSPLQALRASSGSQGSELPHRRFRHHRRRRPTRRSCSDSLSWLPGMERRWSDHSRAANRPLHGSGASKPYQVPGGRSLPGAAPPPCRPGRIGGGHRV
jgi:hypothetical protein